MGNHSKLTYLAKFRAMAFPKLLIDGGILKIS